MYLDVLQEELMKQMGVFVGLSTVWNTLTELGLTRKKVHLPSCHVPNNMFIFIVSCQNLLRSAMRMKGLSSVSRWERNRQNVSFLSTKAV